MRTRTSTQGFVANRREHDLARGLGWFSLGLGIAQLLAPRKLGKLIGVGAHPLLMRLLGLREMASGAGILTQDRPEPWLQARVAGDMMDLALLGTAFLSLKSKHTRVLLAGASVAAVLRLDRRTCEALRVHPPAPLSTLHVVRSVTIDRPAEELFKFWRNFENLPRVINRLRAVRVADEKRSHWVMSGLGGADMRWDAEIVNEHPYELLSWRTLPEGRIQHAGTIRFTPAPGGRGTVVKLEVLFSPPAGVLGATALTALGESPQKQIALDLYRFKQLMETGEIARTEGQPVGPKQTASKYDALAHA